MVEQDQRNRSTPEHDEDWMHAASQAAIVREGENDMHQYVLRGKVRDGGWVGGRSLCEDGDASMPTRAGEMSARRERSLSVMSSGSHRERSDSCASLPRERSDSNSSIAGVPLGVGGWLPSFSDSIGSASAASFASCLEDGR